MRRVFRFKKEEDETWANYCTRTARVAKKIAESMWRAMGWVYNEKPNAVIHTLKQVFRSRSTKWWQSTKAVQMKKDPYNHTRWKHMWAGTTAGVSGTKWLLNGLEMKTGLVKEKMPDNGRQEKIRYLCVAECHTFDDAQDKKWEEKPRKKLKTKYPEYGCPRAKPSIFVKMDDRAAIWRQ